MNKKSFKIAIASLTLIILAVLVWRGNYGSRRAETDDYGERRSSMSYQESLRSETEYEETSVQIESQPTLLAAAIRPSAQLNASSVSSNHREELQIRNTYTANTLGHLTSTDTLDKGRVRPRTGASISGRVLIEGDLPTEKPLPLDQICSQTFSELFPEQRPTTRLYVSEEGGLGDVLVTLVDTDAASTGPQSPPLEIEQVACQFFPYISTAQTGQTIQISNLDPQLHSILTHATSEGTPNGSYAQLPDSPPLSIRFDEPEEFLRIKCDVHPWMYTYINILDHPYHALSQPNGKFSIPKVPAGKYQIKARHRKLGESIQEIELGDQDIQIQFTFRYASGDQN